MTSRHLVVILLVVAACSTNGVEPTTSPTEDSSPAGPATTEDGATTLTGDLACWASQPAGGEEGVGFTDQSEALGLVQPLTGMHGHAAAWGDVDGNGLVDLFVGTFADREPDAYRLRGADGPAPDRLLIQGSDGFEIADLDEMFTRTSGAVFADLDADGDLDLVASRNWDDDSPDAPGTQILRNDGDTLSPVPLTGLPDGFGGRSVAVFDYNADGLADLFIVEDRWSGGRSVLLENQGELQFEDVTEQSGIAADAHGLGVAVADLTNDSYQDILVTGSNRLFVANGDGAFTEVPDAIPAWEVFGEEDDVAGVSVADVNRDGLLDVLIGQHYNSTVDFGGQVPVRLYLNRGPEQDGVPAFEDVTDAAGLIGLPTKAPHVEINDVDNDGWPDVITTASAADGTRPAIFRSQGLSGDTPVFEAPSGLGHPQYWVAGPTADVDRDGRLDIFLVEWEPSLPSLYLRNESASGNWLEVSVGAEEGFGLGWRVEVYEAGGLGDVEALLGAREITVTQGYSAGVAPVAHFGIGEVSSVDVRMIEPNGAGAHDLPGITAGQHIRYPSGCP